MKTYVQAVHTAMMIEDPGEAWLGERYVRKADYDALEIALMEAKRHQTANHHLWQENTAALRDRIRRLESALRNITSLEVDDSMIRHSHAIIIGISYGFNVCREIVNEALDHESKQTTPNHHHPGVRKMPDMIDSTSDARTVNNVMRHEYRVLTPDEKAAMLIIKDTGLAFHSYCESLGKSRELSLAQTRIEEAVMWAIKHLTR